MFLTSESLIEKEKKETIRKAPNSSTIQRNILNVKNVCMKMHKHVTCKVKKKKNIMGSAQSNPNSTQAVQHV